MHYGIALHHIIPGMLGRVIPYNLVTLLCALAASNKENVLAISASVRTRSIARSKSLTASSLLPLKLNIPHVTDLQANV